MYFIYIFYVLKCTTDVLKRVEIPVVAYAGEGTGVCVLVSQSTTSSYSRNTVVAHSSLVVISSVQ